MLFEQELIGDLALMCIVASINAFVNNGSSGHKVQKQDQDRQIRGQEIYCREEH